MCRTILLLLASVPLVASPEWERNMADGHELARKESYRRSRLAYQQAREAGDAMQRGIAHLALAQTWVLQGRDAEAIEEYSRLPSDVPVHLQEEAERRIRELQRKRAGLPLFDPAESRTAIPALPPVALTLHVAPEGNDNAPGTADQPLKTLTGARNAARKALKSGVAGTLEILFRDGLYPVTETMALGPEDSGRVGTPVVYRAAPGSKPSFHGGVRITAMEPVTDGETASRLPESSRGKIFRISLAKNGVKQIHPMKLAGFASGIGFHSFPANELFFNGTPLTLARGPNEGFLKTKDVVVQDGTRIYGRVGSKVGKVRYEGDRPDRWRNEPELLLYGYWFWDWADSYERVVAIDPRAKEITLAEPYAKYGYAIGARFYAVNAVSELDLPGEWHLDTRKGEALFYPPGPVGDARVEMSVLGQRMLHVNRAQNIRFEGLTFETGSADAVRVDGGTNILFAGCTVRNFAGNGIEIYGGATNGILSTDIHGMGRAGTWVEGGDRKTLKPARHFVENCDIHHLSRIGRTYTPAVVLVGVGNRVAHNKMHHIPSSAVRVGGNDHVIEYNEVFNVVLESDDQGAADMFGIPTYRGNVYRFNYWHHIGDWQGREEAMKSGRAGIRLDDAISGTLVYGNIFEHASTGARGFGAVQIHGGKDNIIDNNVFIDCAAAVSFSAWDEPRWQNIAKPALDAREIDKELYVRRYPQLQALVQDPNRNVISRNRTLRVSEVMRHGPKNADLADNRELPGNTLQEVPGFAPIPRELIGLYADDFRRNTAPVTEAPPPPTPKKQRSLFDQFLQSLPWTK